MERLASMYTNWNLCAVLASPWMPPAAQDVVRASTFLILVAVVTVWMSGNMLSIYEELFDSFAPNIILSHTTKMGIMLLYDGLFHFLPFIILGLPTQPISVCIAYGIMLMWYIWARHRISSIYSPKIPFDRGMIVAGIMAIVLAWVLSI